MCCVFIQVDWTSFQNKCACLGQMHFFILLRLFALLSSQGNVRITHTWHWVGNSSESILVFSYPFWKQCKIRGISHLALHWGNRGEIFLSLGQAAGWFVIISNLSEIQSEKSGDSPTSVHRDLDILRSPMKLSISLSKSLLFLDREMVARIQYTFQG